MKLVFDYKEFISSDDKGLVEALDIYVKNIETFLRTDTKEIMKWLDEYNKKYEDRFYLLALTLNGKIIGFAQLVYLLQEKLIFVDYIVIHKDYRKNSAYNVFVEQLKEFFEKKKIEFDYVLGEVGYLNENKELSDSSRYLIRLLKMSEFGVVKTSYYQPMLGRNNYESELMSVLMIYTPNHVKRLKKETFFLLLKAVYFKHYQRWYDRFFDEQARAEYSMKLSDLISKVEAETSGKEYIEINGYVNTFINNSSTIKPRKFLKLAKAVTVILLISGFIILFGAIHVFVKSKFNIDLTAQTYIITGAVIMVFFLLSLFNERKNASIAVIVEKIIDKFFT